MKAFLGVVLLAGFAGASYAGELEELSARAANLDNLKMKSLQEAVGAPVAQPAAETLEESGRAASLTEAQLIKKAAAFIKATAARPDSPFGAIDASNLGLSAYRMGTNGANAMMETISRHLPGLHLNGKTYIEGGPALVVIIVSDDEPIVHMYDQAPETGAMKRIDDFNVTGLSESEELNWDETLMRLINEDNATVISLGSGSASPYWWK